MNQHQSGGATENSPSYQLTCGSLGGPVGENHARLALIGDVVGKPGMRIACLAVDWLKQIAGAEGLIVNAENAADGSGLRCKDFRRLIEAGYDFVTLGDHIYRKREIIEELNKSDRIVRPCNMPSEAPGLTEGTFNLKSRPEISIGVISALGRVFMKPIDCPFKAVEQALDALPNETRIRLLDFHAEATSDKQAMGRFLDGRISAVIGTHTHVPTADACVLPGGTGFQSDVGMTGPFESILGRKIQPVLDATLHSVPVPFQVATDDVRLGGAWIDVCCETGKCSAIGHFQVSQETIEHFEQSKQSDRI